ncbi:hypothetical protein DFH07DRAFT_920901, partial [Mycena maculata]
MTSRPTNSEPLSIPAQRDAINQAIAWHYAQISILKTQANALNPISTLPNEIISKIFHAYAFLSGPPFDLKWAKVMLVCHRWHDIALSEQSLWGFIEVIFSRNLRRISTQLDRSGAAPLTIKITHMESQRYPMMLLEHAERLREVHLAGHAINVLRFMNSLSNHSFPLLQSIKLDPSYKLEEVPEEVPTTFPDALFDGRAPCLTELDMSTISINWSLLRGLHRLSLDLSHDTSQPRTFANILSVLNASPMLTYLKLGRVISPLIPQSSYPTISLPLLDFIWIQDDVDLCDELLRHIIIPPTTRISIYGLGIRSGSDIADLLVPIRKHARAPSAPTLRCLQLEAAESARTNFMISSYTAVTVPNVLEYECGTFLVNTHPTNEHFLRQIMTKVIKALPCTTITH